MILFFSADSKEEIIMDTEKKRKRNNAKKNNSIPNKVRRYGGDIMKSEAFIRSVSETHHLHGTVSSHTLTVCKVSLHISRFLNVFGFRVNEKDLVEAALCHDLGMVGRDEKYDSRTDAWKEHPEESLKIARELIPDLSENAESLILSHMWPVAGPPPRSREAVILNFADKIGSMADWKDYLFRRFSR